MTVSPDRSQFSISLPKPLKQKIVEAAAHMKRSIVMEIQDRLEKSFKSEKSRK